MVVLAFGNSEMFEPLRLYGNLSSVSKSRVLFGASGLSKVLKTVVVICVSFD